MDDYGQPERYVEKFDIWSFVFYSFAKELILQMFKEISSMRKDDNIQEKTINDFLFKNYFQKAFKSAELVFDKEMQTHGVDVIVENASNKKFNIDIKAQSSPKYINNPRPTYILELSTYNRFGTEIFDGWFINPEMITDSYVFVWIHEAKVDERGRIRESEDIVSVEVMNVSKAKLKKHIDALLVGENLDNIVNEMREKKEERRHLSNGIHFSHSPQLPEKPVNLVVHKKMLKKFIVGKFGHCFVTKDSIVECKNIK